jgi:hypothetical protein
MLSALQCHELIRHVAFDTIRGANVAPVVTVAIHLGPDHL